MLPNVTVVTVSDAGNWRMYMGTRTISRRTVVAGAAWAVPAVEAVSALPAFAASGPCLFETAEWRSYSGKGPTSAVGTNVTATATAAAGVGTKLMPDNFYAVNTVRAVSEYNGKKWLQLDQCGADANG